MKTLFLTLAVFGLTFTCSAQKVRLGDVNMRDVVVVTNEQDAVASVAVTNEAALRASGDVAGTNYTDAVALTKVSTNDPAYLAACTGSVFYAGLATYVSNRVVWIGTNAFAAAAQTNVTHNSLLGIEGSGTLHVTATDTNLIKTAWQNPASAAYWTWTSDGTNATMTSYSGPADVVIPDKVDNLFVTGFGTIFQGVAITSISGGNNVAILANEAFQNCTALTNVSFLKLTSTAAGDTFYGCTSLTYIPLPSLTILGGYAFYGCSALTSIIIPSVTTVGGFLSGDYAFAGCTALTAVYFGQNAPAEATDVYFDSPNVTNYVTSSTATGWGATWNGRPVVRMPVTADLFIGSGASVTNIPIAGVTGLQDALAVAVTNNQQNVTLGLASGTTVATATAGSEPITLDQALSLLESSSTLYLSPSNCTVCPQNGVTNRQLSATPSATAWTVVYSGAVTNGQYLFSFVAPSNEVATVLAGNQTANLYMTYAGDNPGPTLTCKMEGYVYDPATSNSTEYAETSATFSVAKSATLPATPTTPIAVIPYATNLTGNLRYQIRVKAITANNVTSVTMWGGSNSISSVSFPVADTVTLGDRGATGIKDSLGNAGTYDSTARTLTTPALTPAGIAAGGGVTNFPVEVWTNPATSSSLTAQVASNTAALYWRKGSLRIASSSEAASYAAYSSDVSFSGSAVGYAFWDCDMLPVGVTNINVRMTWVGISVATNSTEVQFNFSTGFRNSAGASSTSATGEIPHTIPATSTNLYVSNVSIPIIAGYTNVSTCRVIRPAADSNTSDARVVSLFYSFSNP
jgi:hypothetical protein